MCKGAGRRGSRCLSRVRGRRGDTEALSALSHLMQVCPFSLRVVSVVGITYLLPQEEQPLCHPTVER